MMVVWTKYLLLKGFSSVEPSINECFTGKNAMNWKVVGVISGEKTLLDYLW